MCVPLAEASLNEAAGGPGPCAASNSESTGGSSPLSGWGLAGAPSESACTEVRLLGQADRRRRPRSRVSAAGTAAGPAAAPPEWQRAPQRPRGPPQAPQWRQPGRRGPGVRVRVIPSLARCQHRRDSDWRAAAAAAARQGHWHMAASGGGWDRAHHDRLSLSLLCGLCPAGIMIQVGQRPEARRRWPRWQAAAAARSILTCSRQPGLTASQGSKLRLHATLLVHTSRPPRPWQLPGRSRHFLPEKNVVRALFEPRGNGPGRR
jgi:hypothetical protein